MRIWLWGVVGCRWAVRSGGGAAGDGSAESCSGCCLYLPLWSFVVCFEGVGSVSSQFRVFLVLCGVGGDLGGAVPFI